MGNVWDAMKKHEGEKEKAEPPQERKRASGAFGSDEQAVKEATKAALPAGGNKYSPLLVTYHDPGGMLAEQYRSLRTNALARSPQQQLCMVITSAEAGEGKTVTCLNLSFVLAELPDIKVVVIDGDLRKGKLTSLLHARKSPGFAELLRGTSTLNDVIQPTMCPNLDVISAGMVNRGELGEVLSRFQMSEILYDLRRKYKCVIFDTPPMNAVSDAGVIGRGVGEALFVVRMNKTTREAVDRAVGLLHAADVKISGMFLTHQKHYVPKYYDYYY
jgi:capsular exopolysaccharide synthesis family protein